MTLQTEGIGPKEISLEELREIKVPYGRQIIEESWKQAKKDLKNWDPSVNERTFDIFKAKATEHFKDIKRPITKETQGIYRLKYGGKEYLMHHSLYKSYDWKRNKISWTFLEGRISKPIFHVDIDPNTGEIIDNSAMVDGHETIYDIAYTKEKAQELVDMYSTDAAFQLIVVDQNGRKYSCAVDEFVNGDYDELISIKSGFAQYMEERQERKGRRK
jgi:hypothetical protein